MALCGVGALSNLPNPAPFTPAPSSHTRLPWKPSIPLKKHSISGFTTGVPYYANLTIRLATSGEFSSFTSQYVKDDPDGSVTTEDTQSDAQNYAYEAVQTETPKQEEKYDTQSEAQNNVYEAVQSETPTQEEKYDTQLEAQNNVYEAVQSEIPKPEEIYDTQSEAQNNAYEAVQSETLKQEETYDGEASKEDSLDFQVQLSKLFDQLGIEYEPENSSPIYLFGGGALLAVWLTSAVVGAVDSIPLFPKLMELVGIGYTVWFSIRYLLFKNTREELAAKIEDIKQQVLG